MRPFKWLSCIQSCWKGLAAFSIRQLDAWCADNQLLILFKHINNGLSPHWIAREASLKTARWSFQRLFMQTKVIWCLCSRQWWWAVADYFLGHPQRAGTQQQHHSAEKKQRGSRHITVEEGWNALNFGRTGSDRMQNGNGVSCFPTSAEKEKAAFFFYLFIYLQKRGDRLAADSSRVSDKSCCWSIHYLLQHILATRLWVMIRRGSRGCHVRNRKYIMDLSSPPLTYSNPRSVCWHVCGLNTTLK